MSAYPDESDIIIDRGLDKCYKVCKSTTFTLGYSSLIEGLLSVYELRRELGVIIKELENNLETFYKEEE